MTRMCPHCGKMKSDEHVQQCPYRRSPVWMQKCPGCNSRAAMLTVRRGYGTYKCRLCRNQWVA